ncbi:MAG: Abi family protein [Tenericutes bacterium]|nr:Abi family protein [Mycoplasmatota bacterium]
MYTADITGSKSMKTKLSLDISKEDFIARMEFENKKEEFRCRQYLDLKGVSYHTVLVNYIELNENGKLEYKKVQNLYIYDKRIRKILYKFLSALEEGIRGYISNKYCSDINSIKKISNSISKSIVEGSSLSKELENLDFSQLLNISKKLKKSELIELFGSSDHLKENLYAVKELRNTVSHHRMLFVYEDFQQCFFNDGTFGDTLMDNIRNLKELLNTFYEEFFIEEINNSCIDKDNPQFQNSLPNKAILSIKN